MAQKYVNTREGLRDFLRNYRERKGGVLPKKTDVVWDPKKKTWTLSDAFRSQYVNQPPTTPNPNLLPTTGPGPNPSTVGPSSGTPGVNPISNPSVDPETEQPETNPGTPGTTPGTTPETGPGTDPGGIDPGGPEAPEPIDPAIRDAILGTYNTLEQQINRDTGAAYNAAANQARDRIGQVANQQRQAYVNDFVGRGIAGSPALYSDEALGGVNRGETEAVTNALLGINQQFDENRLSSLGMLNNATQTLLGLGNTELDYDLAAKDYGLNYKKFLQDRLDTKADRDLQRSIYFDPQGNFRESVDTDKKLKAEKEIANIGKKYNLSGDALQALLSLFG